MDDDEVLLKLENPGNSFNGVLISCDSNGLIEIKTEQVEDIEIKQVDLHHSIDIKEEVSILQDDSEIRYQFECGVCKTEFTNESELYEHKKIHTGEKPYSCEICDYKGATKSKLNVHLRTHSVRIPLVCKICDRTFKQTHHFTSHFTRIHAREKPREVTDSTETFVEKKVFACEFCNYKVSHSGLLKAHSLKRHIREKLHECEICDRKFVSRYNLDLHLKTHVIEPENVSEDKTVVCNVCEREFARESYFRVHFAKIHSRENPRAREMLLNRSPWSHSF